MHIHTHTFNSPFSGTTRVSRYQKGKTNLDFTEARDSEWQLHQLGHMQVCNSLQTNNHATTPPLSFLQARCPSCHPTNNVKALKALKQMHIVIYNLQKKLCSKYSTFFKAKRYSFSSSSLMRCNSSLAGNSSLFLSSNPPPVQST